MAGWWRGRNAKGRQVVTVAAQGCSVCGWKEEDRGPCGMEAHFSVGADPRTVATVREALGEAYAVEGTELRLCRKHGTLLELGLVKSWRCAGLYVKPKAWTRREYAEGGRRGVRNDPSREVELTTWPGDVVGRGTLGRQWYLFGRIRVRTVSAVVGGVRMSGVWSCDGGDLVRLRERGRAA